MAGAMPSESRRIAVGTLVTCCAATAACHSGALTAGSNHLPEPAVYTLALPAAPDSALKLAKFALGAIDGLQQLPQIRPKMTIVSTHYVRNRRGGGQTEVAVMVAVDRLPVDTVPVRTVVELRAWALDMAQQQTAGQRRSGFPSTALSTNAPALRRPRGITPADTLDWQSLTFVLEAFEKLGAQRLPD